MGDDGTSVATLFEAFRAEITRLQNLILKCSQLLDKAGDFDEKSSALEIIWKNKDNNEDSMKFYLQEILGHPKSFDDERIVDTALEAIFAIARGGPLFTKRLYAHP
jgi:hypothetical protein